MFEEFTVGAGKARFDEHIEIGGDASDCKVSGRDTHSALCAFEFTGTPPAPQVHEVLSLDEFHQLFEAHGMSLLGPPMVGAWEVAEDPTVAPAGRLVEPNRKV